MQEIRCENGDVIVSGQFSFLLWPKGTVEKDSYSISRFNETSSGTAFVASGINLPMERDIDYKLRGAWKASDKGTMLRVNSYEMVRPSSRRGFISYMRALKCGIGPDRAGRIHDTFGESVWSILDTEPEKLLTVRGVTRNILSKLQKKLEDTKVERELSALFGGEQLTGQKIYKLHEKLGRNAVEMLKKNPYIICSFDGFGFRTADRLARRMGTDPAMEERLLEAIQYIFDEFATNGHTCVPAELYRDRLYQEVNRDYPGNPVTMDMLRMAMEKSFLHQEVKASRGGKDGTVYLYSRPRYDQELELSNGIRSLLQARSKPVGEVDQYLRQYEKEVGMKLAPCQRAAVINAFRYKVTIITGGAGTGKTTTLRAILSVHEKVYGKESRPVLMAPTGRAASRMTEATGVPASTVHSLIAFRGENERQDHHRLDPDGKLEGNLFVVDECSMMDLFISQALIRKIPMDARVIFVGDPGQLPSVGCGNVLYDMIRSSAVPTTKLDVIFRQAQENPIVYNSIQIREGKTELLEAPQFSIWEAADTEEIFRKACCLYYRAVQKRSPEDVMLLCPYRSKSDLNVDRFNRKLQQLVNPPVLGEPIMKKGNTQFRRGDRVMQMKNTEEAHNGDVGVILRIEKSYDEESDSERNIAVIEFNGDHQEHYYDENMIYELDLAYCTTIHKAQGSEAPIVILALCEQHTVALRRALIYTGVTRAKGNFLLVTEQGRRALYSAIENDTTDERYSLLSQRLRRKSE